MRSYQAVKPVPHALLPETAHERRSSAGQRPCTGELRRADCAPLARRDWVVRSGRLKCPFCERRCGRAKRCGRPGQARATMLRNVLHVF